MQRDNSVVSIQPGVPDKVYDHNGLASFVLGVTILISTGLVLLCCAVAITVGFTSTSPDGSNAGFWAALVLGVCFIPSTLVGAFAIAAGKTQRMCLIITMMLFAMLFAVVVAPLQCWFSYGITENGDDVKKSYDPVVNPHAKTEGTTLIVMGVLVFFLGCLEFGLCVTMLIYGCNGICCCKTPVKTDVEMKIRRNQILPYPQPAAASTVYRNNLSGAVDDVDESQTNVQPAKNEPKPETKSTNKTRDRYDAVDDYTASYVKQSGDLPSRLPRAIPP